MRRSSEKDRQTDRQRSSQDGAGEAEKGSHFPPGTSTTKEKPREKGEGVIGPIFFPFSHSIASSMGVCYCSLLFFGSSFIPAESGNVSRREEVQERK